MSLFTRQYWEETFRNQFVLLGTVLGIALIVCTLIAAGVASHLKSLNDTLSVTGSAQSEVQADSVKWSFQISRTVGLDGIGTGNTGVSNDLSAVRAFLKSHQVPDSEITVDPVMTNQTYGNNGTPNGYTLSRTIIINSKRVADIGALAQDLSPLSNQGIVVQANAPEYYYSKLSDIRVTLLRDAVKDAKTRADAIAVEGGQHVGRMQSSSSGIVQVLAPNSVNIDDYGQYDTSSVTKEVMVTVHATFYVN
ncbi:MAG TPA: SIMPL domain-containing protein [Candidatus Paceibacterota bacterium]|nr:SIMPL domain-containing protein [Candidatus Paceibacterota bacterium]